MKWVVIVSVVLLLSACLSLKNNNVTQEIELILIPSVQPGKLETKFDIVLKSENPISNPKGYIKSIGSLQSLTFTSHEAPLSKTWVAAATIIPIDLVKVELEYNLYGYLKRTNEMTFTAEDGDSATDATLTMIRITPESTEATTSKVYASLESIYAIALPTGYIIGKNKIYELNFKQFGNIWTAETSVATSEVLISTTVEYYVFKKYAYVREKQTKLW